MPRCQHCVTASDLMDLETYTTIRREHGRKLRALRQDRRVALGPHATIHFENYDTIVYQIQEMLAIEQGGPEQIPDELHAYNPLVPNGSELVATIMFEIDNRTLRRSLLGRLGGVEETFWLEVNESRVEGQSERDVDRTTTEGKASSIQFVHFPLDARHRQELAGDGARIRVGTDHPHYRYVALLPERVRQELATDFEPQPRTGLP